MPIYYFEPEGPDWRDYRDIDGAELSNNAEALIYAYRIVGELKEDGNINERPIHMLVKNAERKIIFRIAFE